MASAFAPNLVNKFDRDLLDLRQQSVDRFGRKGLQQRAAVSSMLRRIHADRREYTIAGVHTRIRIGVVNHMENGVVRLNHPMSTILARVEDPRCAATELKE